MDLFSKWPLNKNNCYHTLLFGMEESPFDFGELSQDENFKQRVIGFRKDVESASKMMETFFAKYNYDELSPGDKVRIRGVDPNQHEIKGQINRVRDYMNKSKKVYERKTIMPRLDQGAAKRFVKNGLWMPKNLKSSETDSKGEVPHKRKKKN